MRTRSTCMALLGATLLLALSGCWNSHPLAFGSGTHTAPYTGSYVYRHMRTNEVIEEDEYNRLPYSSNDGPHPLGFLRPLPNYDGRYKMNYQRIRKE